MYSARRDILESPRRGCHVFGRIKREHGVSSSVLSTFTSERARGATSRAGKRVSRGAGIKLRRPFQIQMNELGGEKAASTTALNIRSKVIWVAGCIHRRNSRETIPDELKRIQNSSLPTQWRGESWESRLEGNGRIEAAEEEKGTGLSLCRAAHSRTSNKGLFLIRLTNFASVIYSGFRED